MNSSFFLDDNTALTLPAIPERDLARGRRSEVNAQLPLSSSGPGASRAIGPHRNWSLPRADEARVDLTPPQILHEPSQQTSNHMPPSPSSFLASSLRGHVESNCSLGLLMIVKSTLYNTSACSSHLYVQPRLHIHG